MRKFLAEWRIFQDAIVWNPLCRYTILPGIMLVVAWLAGLLVAMVGQDRSNEDGVGAAAWLAAWVVALLLTGRWMPTLIGFVFGLSAALDTFSRHHVDTLAIVLPLMVFGVVAFWLISLDRDKFANCQALPPWMKWLMGLSVGFMFFLLLLVLPMAIVSQSEMLPSGVLLSLSAAFWFTVFFDLIWRMSHGWIARILHGLINAAVLCALCLGFYVGMFKPDSPNGFWAPGVLIGILAIIVCQFWSHRAADRDAGRRGEALPVTQPVEEKLNDNL